VSVKLFTQWFCGWWSQLERRERDKALQRKQRAALKVSCVIFSFSFSVAECE